MNISDRTRRFALLGFGLAVLVGLVLLADPLRVAAQIAAAQPAWIGVASLLILAASLVGAGNSYLITGAAAARSFGAFLKGYWAAWAIGLVVPGQVGDVITLSAYLRRHGIPLPVSLGRVGTDKLISLVCSLLVSTQLYRLADYAWLRTASALAALLTAALLTMPFVARAFAGLKEREIRQRWLATLLGALTEARTLVLDRPGVILINFFLSIVKIAFTGLSYTAVLIAVTGGAPDPAAVTIAAMSAGLVAYLPLSANGIGLVEVTGVSLFGFLGLTISNVVSMYVILRFLNLLLAWLPLAVQLLVTATVRPAR